MSETETPFSNDAGLQRESSKACPIGRPWRKGQSGNPSGKRRGTVSLRAAAKRVVSRRDAEEICRKLVAAAKDGNLKAAKLLGELLGDIGALRPVGGEPAEPMVIAIGCTEAELPWPRNAGLSPAQEADSSSRLCSKHGAALKLER